MASSWFVYIIRCSDNSLYTGITTDINRRFNEHKNHHGAKYFYAHTALEIVYFEAAENRSLASQREFRIKKLTVKNKKRLISSIKNQLLH